MCLGCRGSDGNTHTHTHKVMTSIQGDCEILVPMVKANWKLPSYLVLIVDLCYSTYSCFVLIFLKKKGLKTKW